MENQSYHHGDLKNALIEAGIRIVHKEGVQQLSLRKVAAKCGVSHAAPYKHFKDKESLLEAMQQHITNRFSALLIKIADKYSGSEDILQKLGSAYFNFFCINPHYFHFLFSQMNVPVDLDNISVASYPPFDIFKNTVINILQANPSLNELQYKKSHGEHGKASFSPKATAKPQNKDILQNVIAMWAMIHGITAIATMNGVQYSGKWDILLNKIMNENFVMQVDSY